MEETNNEAKSGEYYNCTLTGWAKRTEKTYGRDATEHLIITVALKPDGIDNCANYYADVPLVFTPGKKWAFYDKAAGASVERTTTSADTVAALEYAKKCFPDWAEYCETLEDGDFGAAFSWFGSEASEGAKCRAKLSNRSYVGKDGQEHVEHSATLFEVKSLTVVDDKFDATFGKVLKASGVKFGKGRAMSMVSGRSAGGNAPAPQEKPVAPAPAAPIAPAATGKTATKDECWTFYHAYVNPGDASGNGFWQSCADALNAARPGLNTAPFDYADWTPEDWGHILANFKAKAAK